MDAVDGAARGAVYDGKNAVEDEGVYAPADLPHGEVGETCDSRLRWEGGPGPRVGMGGDGGEDHATTCRVPGERVIRQDDVLSELAGVHQSHDSRCG